MNSALTGVCAMLTVAATGYSQFIGFDAVNAVPSVVIEALPKYEFGRSGHIETISYMVTVICSYDGVKSLSENISDHAERVNTIVSNLAALSPTVGYLAAPSYTVDRQIEIEHDPGEQCENFIYGYFSISGGLN